MIQGTGLLSHVLHDPRGEQYPLELLYITPYSVFNQPITSMASGSYFIQSPLQQDTCSLSLYTRQIHSPVPNISSAPSHSPTY